MAHSHPLVEGIGFPCCSPPACPSTLLESTIQHKELLPWVPSSYARAGGGERPGQAHGPRVGDFAAPFLGGVSTLVKGQTINTVQ